MARKENDMRRFKNILIVIAIMTFVGTVMYLFGFGTYIRPIFEGFIIGMIAGNIERIIIQKKEKKEGKNSEN